jgi:hypothetical protein
MGGVPCVCTLSGVNLRRERTTSRKHGILDIRSGWDGTEGMGKRGEDVDTHRKDEQSNDRSGVTKHIVHRYSESKHFDWMIDLLTLTPPLPIIQAASQRPGLALYIQLEVRIWGKGLAAQQPLLTFMHMYFCLGS